MYCGGFAGSIIRVPTTIRLDSRSRVLRGDWHHGRKIPGGPKHRKTAQEPGEIVFAPPSSASPPPAPNFRLTRSDPDQSGFKGQEVVTLRGKR
jgi:hypothetical protein